MAGDPEAGRHALQDIDPLPAGGARQTSQYAMQLEQEDQAVSAPAHDNRKAADLRKLNSDEQQAYEKLEKALGSPNNFQGLLDAATGLYGVAREKLFLPTIQGLFYSFFLNAESHGKATARDFNRTDPSGDFRLWYPTHISQQQCQVARESKAPEMLRPAQYVLVAQTRAQQSAQMELAQQDAGAAIVSSMYASQPPYQPSAPPAPAAFPSQHPLPKASAPSIDADPQLQHDTEAARLASLQSLVQSLGKQDSENDADDEASSPEGSAPPSPKTLPDQHPLPQSSAVPSAPLSTQPSYKSSAPVAEQKTQFRDDLQAKAAEARKAMLAQYKDLPKFSPLQDDQALKDWLALSPGEQEQNLDLLVTQTHPSKRKEVQRIAQDILARRRSSVREEQEQNLDAIFAEIRASEMESKEQPEQRTAEKSIFLSEDENREYEALVGDINNKGEFHAIYQRMYQFVSRLSLQQASISDITKLLENFKNLGVAQGYIAQNAYKPNAFKQPQFQQWSVQYQRGLLAKGQTESKHNQIVPKGKGIPALSPTPSGANLEVPTLLYNRRDSLPPQELHPLSDGQQNDVNEEDYLDMADNDKTDISSDYDPNSSLSAFDESKSIGNMRMQRVLGNNHTKVKRHAEQARENRENQKQYPSSFRHANDPAIGASRVTRGQALRTENSILWV